MNKSKSKILDLLYGKIFTYAERIDGDDETDALFFEADDIEEEFADKIKHDAELTELFKKYVHCEAEARIAQSDVFYSEGFKMGLLIGLEAGEWVSNKMKR